MSFSDIKTKGKLMLVFGFFFLFLVSVAAVGFWGTSKFNRLAMGMRYVGAAEKHF